MSTELTITESGLVPQNPMQILTLAIQQGVGVDVMERLLDMQERMNASAAKAAFDKALSDFQAECPIIKKSKDGYNKAYRYAPLDEIIHQVRGLLRTHGFSYTIDTETVSTERLKAVCKITHIAGHSEVSTFEVPIDNNQKNLMSTPQRWGGASTYAKRYCFCNAFGILTSDEDRDGSEGMKEPMKSAPQSGQKSPKGRLWDAAHAKFQESPPKLKEWLIGKGLIEAGQALNDLTHEQVDKLLPHVEEAEFQF